MADSKYVWTCPNCGFHGELSLYARCVRCHAPHFDFWHTDPVYGMISHRLTEQDMRAYREGTVTQKELLDRVSQEILKPSSAYLKIKNKYEEKR